MTGSRKVGEELIARPVTEDLFLTFVGRPSNDDQHSLCGDESPPIFRPRPPAVPDRPAEPLPVVVPVLMRGLGNSPRGVVAIAQGFVPVSKKLLPPISSGSLGRLDSRLRPLISDKTPKRTGRA